MTFHSQPSMTHYRTISATLLRHPASMNWAFAYDTTVREALLPPRTRDALKKRSPQKPTPQPQSRRWIIWLAMATIFAATALLQTKHDSATRSQESQASALSPSPAEKAAID